MAKPPHILVVDDDESNRESLRRRLERRGYTVSVAAGGREALELVGKKPLDLVILDVMMPGINGLEVLDILRQTFTPTQLPVIMATARDQSGDVVAALDRGANDYVTKPLDFAVVAARVRTQLELKSAVDQILELEATLQARNDQLKTANARLTENAKRTAAELTAAAKVQQAFLPPADPHVSEAKFAWAFQPCTELAGDFLDIAQLDDHNVAFYLLDVSGHGVAASLLAVTIARLLSPVAGGETMIWKTGSGNTRHLSEPSEIAARLSKHFSIDATDQFVTLFYATCNTATRELRYVSAGHPGAIRIRANAAPEILHGTGQPIGIGTTFETQTTRLEVNDRIYLYSDGITEARDPAGNLLGTDRLVQILDREVATPLPASVLKVLNELTAWQAGAVPKDDISILAMQCS